MITLNEIKSKRKGAFYKVKVLSESGFLKKGKESDLQKVETLYLRFGIDYENMKSTKEKRMQQLANGLPQANRVDWWQWVDYKYLIEHKTNGTQYIRAYINKGLKNLKPQVEYFLNGEPKEKQWLIDNKYISSSESKHDDNTCIMIKLSNLICFE